MRGATPLAGQLAKQRVTPYKDRRVAVMSVPCPECRAPTGEACKNAQGRASSALKHRSRRRMAIRANA